MKVLIRVLIGFSLSIAAGLFNAQAANFTFKLGHVAPPTHPYNTGALELARLAAEYSGGTIKIEVFPASQLGNERDLIEGVGLGTVDMALTATGPLMGFERSVGALDIPYVFRDLKHARGALDGPVGERVFKSLETHRLKGLAWFENGFRDITNSKHEIKTPGDLKGIKLRTLENPIHIAFFKKLGAIPTPMAFGELYTSLEKKVVDGQENPISAIVSAQFYEVQKYLSLTNHVYSGVPVIINLNKYNSLSDQQKEALNRASKEASTYMRNQLDELGAKDLATLKEKGVVVTEVDKGPFIDAAKEIKNQFGKETSAELLELIDKMN